MTPKKKAADALLAELVHLIETGRMPKKLERLLKAYYAACDEEKSK